MILHAAAKSSRTEWLTWEACDKNVAGGRRSEVIMCHVIVPYMWLVQMLHQAMDRGLLVTIKHVCMLHFQVFESKYLRAPSTTSCADTDMPLWNSRVFFLAAGMVTCISIPRTT